MDCYMASWEDTVVNKGVCHRKGLHTEQKQKYIQTYDKTTFIDSRDN